MVTSSSAPFCFHTRSQVPATLSCLYFPLLCLYTFFSVPRMLFLLFGQSNHHNAQLSPPPGYLLQKPMKVDMALVPSLLHLPWAFPCPSPGTTGASPIGFRCLQGRAAVLSRIHRETPSCRLGQLWSNLGYMDRSTVTIATDSASVKPANFRLKILEEKLHLH